MIKLLNLKDYLNKFGMNLIVKYKMKINSKRNKKIQIQGLNTNIYKSPNLISKVKNNYQIISNNNNLKLSLLKRLFKKKPLITIKVTIKSLRNNLNTKALRLVLVYSNQILNQRLLPQVRNIVQDSRPVLIRI